MKVKEKPKPKHGSAGGTATFKKYGPEHFRNLQKKQQRKIRKMKKLSLDK